MKVLFLEAKKKDLNQNIPSDFSMLPKKICLLATIQFIPLLEKIRSLLEKAGKEVFLGKSKNKAVYRGQILGCDFSCIEKIKQKVDAFLFLCSGKWHILRLVTLTQKPIFFLEGKSILSLTKEERTKFLSFRKAALSRLLFSDEIGVLVSLKPGQQNLAAALKLRKKLRKSKRAFLFLTDNLSKAELENFSPSAWLNTACPGLIFDIPSAINHEEFERIQKNSKN